MSQQDLSARGVPITIEGVEYESVTAAAKSLGIPVSTLQTRVNKSK